MDRAPALDAVTEIRLEQPKFPHRRAVISEDLAHWRWCRPGQCEGRSFPCSDGASRHRDRSWHPQPEPRCSRGRRRCAQLTRRRCSWRRRPGRFEYATLLQKLLERGADEGAETLLGDEVVGGLLIQFRDEVGPIRGKSEVGKSCVGAARSPARHIDKDYRQALLAESAGKFSRAGNDVSRGM